MGVRIFENTKVTGIAQDRGRVTGVVTERGPITAEVVVNCAGMWGREVGRMAALWREAAECLGNPVGPDPGGVEDALALHCLGDGGAGRPSGSAALGVEASGGDRAFVYRQRDAHQIAARGAPCGAAERARRRRAAARLVARVGVK